MFTDKPICYGAWGELFNDIKDTLIPVKVGHDILTEDCYAGCPGKFCNYIDLNLEVFGKDYKYNNQRYEFKTNHFKKST